MGRVLTNQVTLQVAPEVTLGTQPTTAWKTLEPNSIGKYGPALKKIARLPISKNRQPRKPALVDLDSTVEFEHDVTYDYMLQFLEGLFFSIFKNTAPFAVTSVDATGYVVASGGALALNTLILGRGFTNTGNNGVQTVIAGSTGTHINFTGSVIETAPTGATAEICGVLGASADITIDASGNMLSTALDFTTLSIQQWQWIFVGDVAGGANSFATAADRGLAKVTLVAAHKLTLARKSTTFTVDSGAGKQIKVYFGRFLRNVAVDSADWLERTYQFELMYKNLQNPGPGDEFEYAAGNFLNQVQFDIPLTAKALAKSSFIGTTTGNPTTSRATGSSTATPPIATSPVNTSVDLLRLRITNTDETGVSTDFKSISMTIKNGVSAEKALATLGGKYMNVGELSVDVTAVVIFTQDDVLKAMQDNRQVMFEVCLRNADGAFVLDCPALTVEDGGKGFPMNQSVTINMKSSAFQDPTSGFTVGVSTFPFLPAA